MNDFIQDYITNPDVGLKALVTSYVINTVC